MTLNLTLLENIKKGQKIDSYFKNLKIKANSKKKTSFKKLEKRIILFKDRIYVLNNEDLKKENYLQIIQSHIHFILAQQKCTET